MVTSTVVPLLPRSDSTDPEGASSWRGPVSNPDTECACAEVNSHRLAPVDVIDE